MSRIYVRRGLSVGVVGVATLVISIVTGCTATELDSELSSTTASRQSQKMPTDSEQIVAAVEASIDGLRPGLVGQVDTLGCPEKHESDVDEVLTSRTLDSVEDITIEGRSASATVRFHTDENPAVSIVDRATFIAVGNKWLLC